jgi:hypothetical protein
MGKKENETPKSFRLSISLPALNDLDEITDFIRYVNGQPLNAVKWAMQSSVQLKK